VIRTIALAALAIGLTTAPATGAGGAARSAHFQSPSGNINCRVDATSAHCLVKRNAWRRRPSRPTWCDTDWFPAEVSLSGSRLTLGSCRGDVGPMCLPAAGLRCTTLAYGKSVTVGAIRCTSARNGVTCRRRIGRRVGFRIAREGYVLYR
jgi:hypothetical protein